MPVIGENANDTVEAGSEPQNDLEDFRDHGSHFISHRRFTKGGRAST
jgi:hypothetical protein